jgi:hypothetical protein
MSLHDTAFEYLKPTDAQMKTMSDCRMAFTQFASEIDKLLPEGPDKTHIMRRLRDCAMWANVTITRNPDGSPRA